MLTSPKCCPCSKTPPLHATISAPSCHRPRYFNDYETHACGESSRRQDPACYTAPAMVPRPRTRRRSRVPDHRVRTEPLYRHFDESLSTARREGGTNPHKTIIADTMKLLGNSGYGKTVTDVDRHRNVQYFTDVRASSLVNNRRFRQLDVVVDNAYEVETDKKVVKYKLPHHIGFFVYQYAKLHMLQFYYDFVDRYIERPLHQYCEMDIALAGACLDDLLSAEKREHYFRHRNEWLPSECCAEHHADYVSCRLAGHPWLTSASCCLMREGYDKRTPCLFKVE